MHLLALDTATEACSVALWSEERVLARHVVAGRSHTRQLMPMVHALLAEAGLAPSALDGLVCGVGPGSFAGVRIGVGFTKGLALALDRPVTGISSLAMLAQAAIADGATQVLSCIDARMNEVYFGSFERDEGGLARAVGVPGVMPPQAVPPVGSGEWVAAGTGWGTYEAVLRECVRGTLSRVDGAALPRAEHALPLAIPVFAAGAAISADDLAPLYLRDKVALTLEEQIRQRDAKR